MRNNEKITIWTRSSPDHGSPSRCRDGTRMFGMSRIMKDQDPHPSHLHNKRQSRSWLSGDETHDRLLSVFPILLNVYPALFCLFPAILHLETQTTSDARAVRVDSNPICLKSLPFVISVWLFHFFNCLQSDETLGNHFQNEHVHVIHPSFVVWSCHFFILFTYTMKPWRILWESFKNEHAPAIWKVEMRSGRPWMNGEDGASFAKKVIFVVKYVHLLSLSKMVHISSGFAGSKNKMLFIRMIVWKCKYNEGRPIQMFFGLSPDTQQSLFDYTRKYSIPVMYLK